ncbi:ABC transporter permease [Orenia marismortui]|uniref:Putative ABC transport system permease protein n=1 Tax=Orenia marismortui TaxID=46469 RepID=A0A4R8GVD7_9FIRM|nr:FtsX-like permease family protein [Orenia marismortui]TDX48943.1 putative ABC transport system permease protein [Orenia marismortui]
MKKWKMFFRMISQALKERKSRVAIVFFAIVVGIGVISALFSVYYDINIKMSKELRTYGANLALKSSVDTSQEILLEDLEQVVAEFSQEELIGYRPNLYGIAEVESKKSVFKSTKPVVLVGTWFEQVAKINPYWQVEGELPINHDIKDEVVIGQDVAEKLGYDIGDELKLTTKNTWGSEKFMVTAIVETGDDADSRIFVNLSVAERLLATEAKINTAYLSVISKGEDLRTKVTEINEKLSAVDLETIQKIAKSEAKVLDKIKSLMYLVVMVILLSTILCVSTTMMTIVAERKEEIALKKALGADSKDVIIEFLMEAIILGGVGGLIGYGLGFLGAQLIGKSVFDSAISFRSMVLLSSFILSIVVSCVASTLPVSRVVDIDPAVTLKGE